MNLILTVLISAIGSFLFYKLKVPAGAMVGAIIFSAVFNILTGMGCFPKLVRVAVQAIAGGFIGQRISLNDVREMKTTVKPSLQLFLGIVFFSFLTGIVIHAVSDVDITTALLSSVPGGMSDIAMISTDVGADPTQSTALQLVRYLIAILMLPQAATWICSRFDRKKIGQKPVTSLSHEKPQEKPKKACTRKNAVITLLIAAVSGTAGRLSGFPAGAIVFSLFAVAAYNIRYSRAYLPKRLRLLAQNCAGTVIGTGISMHDIQHFHELLVPVILVTINCILMNYVLGLLIYKTNPLDLSTSLFASVPAGLSDMALISLELGGDASKVMVLQLVRYICVMAFMPVMIKVFSSAFPF
ncbi:MAG: hypothetical protein E7476_10000 [Ruminococcaceae bacterium]|nr:hypothetical protein [Oscillospiraceae bacterium]